MIVHNIPTMKGTGSLSILKVLMGIEPFEGCKIIRTVLVKGRCSSRSRESLES